AWWHRSTRAASGRRSNCWRTSRSIRTSVRTTSRGTSAARPTATAGLWRRPGRAAEFEHHPPRTVRLTGFQQHRYTRGLRHHARPLSVTSHFAPARLVASDSRRESHAGVVKGLSTIDAEEQTAVRDLTPEEL